MSGDMGDNGRKKPSGAQNRKARAARMQAALEEAGHLRRAYRERLGDAPLDDPSELVAWLCRVGGVLVEEALGLPDMAQRHKAVANLLAKIGLISAKAQFAGRIEAIEKRLSEMAAPAAATSGTPAHADSAEPPIVVPARGTPLWSAWQARGALPPEGANVVEVPPTSRAYAALLAKEPA